MSASKEKIKISRKIPGLLSWIIDKIPITTMKTGTPDRSIEKNGVVKEKWV